MLKISILKAFLSANLMNMTLCFYEKILTYNKETLDRSIFTTKRIVNKMIFVIISEFCIFQKTWERGGIGRRTALKMRHLRVCRFKSDRSHFDEYL